MQLERTESPLGYVALRTGHSDQGRYHVSRYQLERGSNRCLEQPRVFEFHAAEKPESAFQRIEDCQSGG